GDDDDGGSALVDLLVARQLGVAEYLKHSCDPSSQLIAGRACPSAASGNEREQEDQDPEDARVISDHGGNSFPRSPGDGSRGRLDVAIGVPEILDRSNGENGPSSSSSGIVIPIGHCPKTSRAVYP